MGIINYVVNDGDSLENISMRILGDASRWGEIARFNRLHSPFISNDPLDYFGPPSAQGRIAIDVLATDNVRSYILFPVPNESAIDPQGTFLISERNSDGSLTHDILPIDSYDASTATLTTQLSPVNSYDENSYWYIYPSEIPTKTVRTGDTLYIQDGNTTQVRATQKYYDYLGTDILLDDHGKLQWTNQTVATGSLRITGMNVNTTLTVPVGTFFLHNLSGQIYQSSHAVDIHPLDTFAIIPVSSVEMGLLGTAGQGSSFTLIKNTTSENIVQPLMNAIIVADTLLESAFRPADVALISGAANVRQALVNRLGTRIGELVYHPNYGNQAFEEIGMPDIESEQALIEAYSIQCMRNESRISEIFGGASRRTSDSVYISAGVRVRQTGEKLAIDNVRLRFLTDDSSLLG